MTYFTIIPRDDAASLKIRLHNFKEPASLQILNSGPAAILKSEVVACHNPQTWTSGKPTHPLTHYIFIIYKTESLFPHKVRGEIYGEYIGNLDEIYRKYIGNI